ncbi:MAG: glycosyltransferase family 39 protein [Desulfobacterales bacterium]|nr:glycosyltransferase family 39 protein [Desulfobacterales bacterium]
MNISGFATLCRTVRLSHALSFFSLKTFFKILIIGLLTSLVITVIILASVPPVSRDALTHHLAVPKLYLQHGGMFEIPSLKFSYYPMNLDLLYMIPLFFGNDIIPKFIHFIFALLTAFLIFRYLKNRLDSIYGLLGVLFFLSLPVIIKLSTTVYVDLGLIFFSAAALIYFLKWIENQFKLKYLIISSVYCGLALGTKFNGLIVFFLLTLFVPFIYSRVMRNEAHPRPQRAFGYGVLFMLSALLIYSPWMIRSYIWTNNPVYPLYNNWFNSKPAALTVVEPGDETNPDSELINPKRAAKQPAGKFGHFLIRKLIFQEAWWQTALIPIRIFFEGRDDTPKYFDGKLNPFLFFFPFFAFYKLKTNSPILKIEKKALLLFAVLYLLFAFFQTDMRIRYIAPIIAPLTILSVFGLHELMMLIQKQASVSFRRICTGCVSAVVILLVGMNFAYIVGEFKKVDPMSYLSGQVDRDAYIRKHRPEYSAIQFANRNLAENAGIFCFFLGNRRYYSDREMYFDINLFQRIVQKADSPEKILSDIKNKGMTHLLIKYKQFNDWANSDFNIDEKKMMNAFFNEQVKLLFSEDGYGLYQLEPQKPVLTLK